MLKVSKEKVQLAMAGKCLNPYDLCSKADISYASYQRILRVGGCKIATIGKIAKALDINVIDLLEEEKEIVVEESDKKE